MMMSSPVAARIGKLPARWWRLDPRVAAHLRSPSRPLVGLLVGALAPKRRSGFEDTRAGGFAATKWADTEWADTCSDPLTD